MFERAHHQRISGILKSLDANLLLKCGCFFGGGTAIALSRGEYRESVDVDFICSSVDGYRVIRQRVNVLDQTWLFKHPVSIVREPRVDKYGIRLGAAVDDVPIKIEITFEGRIALKDPIPEDKIEGVWTLSQEDLVATKLMANADRYGDDSVMSRDLIDLAMLSDDCVLDATGISKARHAYGDSIDKAFVRSKELLLGREGRLTRCMKDMRMTIDPDSLRERILKLSLEKPGNKVKPARLR